MYVCACNVLVSVQIVCVYSSFQKQVVCVYVSGKYSVRGYTVCVLELVFQGAYECLLCQCPFKTMYYRISTFTIQYNHNIFQTSIHNSFPHIQHSSHGNLSYHQIEIHSENIQYAYCFHIAAIIRQT